MNCYACSADLSPVIPDHGAVPRSASCPNCHRDVRVCRNCRFYDRAYQNECRESSAERVLDKEKANFCDYFSFSGNTGTAVDKRKKIEKGFDDLFKK